MMFTSPVMCHSTIFLGCANEIPESYWWAEHPLRFERVLEGMIWYRLRFAGFSNGSEINSPLFIAHDSRRRLGHVEATFNTTPCNFLSLRRGNCV